MYNYQEAMKNDIISTIHDCQDYGEDGYNFKDYETIEDFYDFIVNGSDLINYDEITGNLSGSYTLCRETAKQYVSDYFFSNPDPAGWDSFDDLDKQFIVNAMIERDFEKVDVFTRCALFSNCAWNACQELKGEFNAAHAENLGDQVA